MAGITSHKTREDTELAIDDLLENGTAEGDIDIICRNCSHKIEE